MTIARVVWPRFQWFTGLMWKKLSRPENQAKEDWRHESRQWLLARLLQEVSELVEADPADAAAVAAECADVANFAMMIADEARRAQEAG